MRYTPSHHLKSATKNVSDTWLKYLNFDSLKVNISFHDRNFWLSKTFPVCLCQLFQLFSPNKLHCSSHWTSIYKMLEIKLFYFVISELSTKLPQGNRSSWTFLTISSDSPFTLFDYHRLITSTWTLVLKSAVKCHFFYLSKFQGNLSNESCSSLKMNFIKRTKLGLAKIWV